MRIKILPLLFLIGFSFTQTNVNGNVSGTWDIEGSPYIVVGNILILEPDSLTIDPGVEVRFDAEFRIDVMGALFAVGTQQDSISFVSHEGARWKSINFLSMSNDQSALEYCIIDGGSESGYEPFFGMINADNSSPTISNSRISDGIDDAIRLTESSSVISNNIITGISGDGIESSSGGVPTITGNTFLAISTRAIYLDDGSDTQISDNSFANIGNRAIYLGIGDNTTITNNSFNDIDDHGIYLENGGTGSTISDNVLDDVGEDNGDYGIFTQNANNSVISNNNITNTGYAIHISSDATGAEFTSNTISEMNYNGIYIGGSCDGCDISLNTLTDMNNQGIYIEESAIGISFNQNTLTDVNGYGIRVVGEAPGSSFTSNSLTDINSRGIQVGGNMDNGVISDNTFSNIGNPAIYIDNGSDHSDNLQVIDNDIQNINGWGIYINGVNTLEIANNNIQSANSGIYAYGNNMGNGAITNNIINGNSGGFGIEIYDLDNIEISSNEISGKSRGIDVHHYSDNIDIHDNIISDNDGRGINIYYNSNNNKIYSNTITNNSLTGVHSEYDNDNLEITNNIITGNGNNDNYQYGIYIYEYHENTLISDNLIDDNAQMGIYIYHNNNYDTEVLNNIISNHNQYGIYMSPSSSSNGGYIDIIDNLIINNGERGVYLNYMRHNHSLIRNNTIDNHSSYGVYYNSYNSDAPLDLINNSITNNGTGLHISSNMGGDVVSYNNVFNNNTDFSGNLPDGTGTLNLVNTNNTLCDEYNNISGDPLYQDPENENFHLQFGSINIGAGDPSYTDEDGTVSDIGVYPFLDDVSLIYLYIREIDFGTVNVGQSGEYAFDIHSMGSDALEISSISVDNDIFTLSEEGPITLYPGELQSINVIFTPLESANYSADITILSDSDENPEYTIELSGVGYIPPNIEISPPSISATALFGQDALNQNITLSNSGTDQLNWSLSIEEHEYAVNFTSCGASGRWGPTQEQCDSDYGSSEIEVLDGIQYWTVPTRGIYRIEVKGADGGKATYYNSQGGEGAFMSGSFDLEAGDVLKILVGQAGQTVFRSSGGGGGSFIAYEDNTPLIVAGGGGGVRYDYNNYNEFGTTDNCGNNASSNGSGGCNGDGGAAPNTSGGAGGGGFYGDGADGNGSCSPGLSFVNGGAGGDNYDDQAGEGGFGGGGGGEWSNYGAAGGGGGYSGGAGGYYTAGGGGSYNASTMSQINENGSNDGSENHGHVKIYLPSDVRDNFFTASPTSGEIAGGSSLEVTLNFFTDILAGNYFADLVISSNDPEDAEVSVPVNYALLSSEASYIYVEQQQVERGEDETIPLKVHVSENDNISGLIFALSVTPGAGVEPISEELGLSLVIGYGADAVMTQTGDGAASILLTGFDPPLNNDDVTIGHIILPVPDGTNNGDVYYVNFSSVSGTTEDYELVQVAGMSNIVLTVITEPPVIGGLYDVLLLENSAMVLGFTVNDPEGSEVSMEMIDAPDYVTMNYETGDDEGTIEISPGFGAQGGEVVLVATNNDALVPEQTEGSFTVSINHYPVFSPTENYYILEGESASIDIQVTDVDGDSISIALQSAPDYVSYEPYNNYSGQVILGDTNGGDSGDIIFDISDNGVPSASTTSGFYVVLNHNPDIFGITDIHIVENQSIDTLITFYDIDGDSISYQVDHLPDYSSYSEQEDGMGILVSISPNSSSIDDYIQFSPSSDA